MRQPILFVCALIALLGSLVAALATTDQRDTDLRGYADPVRDKNLPFRISRLGVNAELTQYELDELERQLDLMEGAQVHWIRQTFSWDEIEASAGNYDWEKWDAIVEAVAARPQLELVAVLVNTPEWARTTQPQAGEVSPAVLRTAPPEDPATFADFTRTFAERYGDSIDVYQIWDEPNLFTNWGGYDPRAADYAVLLQAAYEEIHSTDTTATVISAALAPTTETGGKNVSDWLYLRDLYALGAGAYMDAVAAKPYGFDLPPGDRTVNMDVLNFSRMIGLREIMVENGDGTKPLWASNWGWNSLPENWTGLPSIWGSVTGEEQVIYTIDALTRANREWAWLGGMTLYHWQPDAAPDDPVWGFAVIDQNGNPTPLWDALSQLLPQQYAQHGLYRVTNPYAEYSGVWTFSELGADIGWLRDSRLEFQFVGQDVGLLVREDDYTAYLYATVDGEQANALPHDNAGNAYLVLTSDTLEPELNVVPVAQNLPYERHQLNAVADRGFDRWAVVGYAVSSGNLADPYNRQIAVAWMTAFFAAAALMVTGWQMEWHKIFSPLSTLWNGLNATAQLGISLVTSLALMIGMLLTWNDALPLIFRREPVQLAAALVTAGLLYLHPHIVITVIAALALFVIVYNRLIFGLMLTIFYAPFFLFPVELYRFAFPMAELVTLITFTAWMLRMLADWGKARKSGTTFALPPLNMLDYGVIAWVLLGLFSLAWAEMTGRAVTELRTMMVEPALFYLMLRTIKPTEGDLLRLVDSMLFAGLMVAVIGLFLYLRGEGIITAEESARRLASVYGSPNNVALFLGRCIPFALAFFLMPIDRMRRIFAGIVLIFSFVAVVLTQSVGGLFIGIPAAVAAVLLMIYKRRAVLPLLALVVIAAACFVVATSVSERFAKTLDFSEGTNFYRLRVWESALDVISDHPVTGLGLDQFLYAFRGEYIRPDAENEPNLSHPHNFVLDFWVRLGIGGVLVFGWLQLMFWRKVRLNLLKPESDVMLFALVVGMAGSMVNLLAHGLIDNSIFVIDLAYIFFLLLALSNETNA